MPAGEADRYAYKEPTIDVGFKRFSACMFCAFALWSVWCALMAWVGFPFDLPVVRALARFIALAGPACIWLHVSGDHPADRLGITTNWLRGVITGLIVSLVWALLHFSYAITLPNSIHSWLNVIFLSPIAEELLFRRAAIEYGIKQGSAFRTVLISSLLFSLIHLPWWLFSAEQSLLGIILGLSTMFLYGLVFGGLYVATKSIWASLIPHWANNFIACSIAT